MSVPVTIEAPSADQPSRQALEAVNRSAPGKVTGRLKAAIDKMVWEGARRKEAAEASSMTDHSLRAALTKPHVKAYYLQQLDVLRTSERARNILALVDVRDQVDNKMARVAAVKALEQLSDGDNSASSSTSAVPGVVIQILTPATQQQFKTIDIEPVLMKSDG